MAWTIQYAESAVRQLKKLDRSVAVKILEYLDERVAFLEDPRSVGKKLSGSRLGNYWRYCIGDVRVICDVQDLQLIVLVLELGHRKEVYR